MTYQVADNDLALAGSPGGLGRSGLDSVATNSLGILLNAADWRSSSRAAGGATSGSSAASDAALGGENLVERLIKLARRHVVWMS